MTRRSARSKRSSTSPSNWASSLTQSRKAPAPHPRRDRSQSMVGPDGTGGAADLRRWRPSPSTLPPVARPASLRSARSHSPGTVAPHLRPGVLAVPDVCWRPIRRDSPPLRTPRQRPGTVGLLSRRPDFSGSLARRNHPFAGWNSTSPGSISLDRYLLAYCATSCRQRGSAGA
jgi:hypothetical protein